MPRAQDKLEALFAKLRTLPQARQELAVEALAEVAEDEIYFLSDDESAVLEPEREAVRWGEFAADRDIDEILDKPCS